MEIRRDTEPGLISTKTIAGALALLIVAGSVREDPFGSGQDAGILVRDGFDTTKGILSGLGDGAMSPEEDDELPLYLRPGFAEGEGAVEESPQVTTTIADFQPPPAPLTGEVGCHFHPDAPDQGWHEHSFGPHSPDGSGEEPC